MKRKNIIYLIVIIAIIWFFVKCIGSNDNKTTSDIQQETDYSWIYGTWKMTIDGETHIVSFSENGIYIEYFKGMFGNITDSGTYTINSDCIELDSGDGYPSYIEIKGKRLASDGHYYTKSSD